jgi:hypothetical protein
VVEPDSGYSQRRRADLEALAAFLAPCLDRLDPGLGAAACDYVLHAGPSSVLARLAGLCGGPQARAHLSSLLGYGREPPCRRVFLACEGWDPGIVQRLGEVLAVVAKGCGLAARWPGSAVSPEFLRALAHVTINLLQEGGSDPATWLLTAPRCLELLSLTGGDQAQLADVLWGDLAQDQRQGRRRLWVMSGLDGALAAAPARTLQAVRGLDAEGRLAFLALAGRVPPGAFTDHLLDRLAHGQGRERDAALTALAGCDSARQAECAARLLAQKDPASRIAAARLLSRTGSGAAQARLAAHLPTETDARAQAAMRLALGMLAILTREPGAAADGVSGYVAMDGAWIAIPEAPPAPASGPLPPGLREALCRAAQEVCEASPGWCPPGEQGAAVQALMEVLAGERTPQAALGAVRALLGRSAAHRLHPQILQRLRSQMGRALAQPGITPEPLVRALALDQGRRGRWASFLVCAAVPCLPARLLRAQAVSLGDLRPVAGAAAALGGGREVMAALLRSHPASWPGGWFKALLWPLVAEHLAMIDAALGLIPAPLDARSGRLSALTLLSLLPAPPRRHLPALMDLAVKGRGGEPRLARRLLSAAPDLQPLLTALLGCGDPASRRGAAGWLGERGERSAVPVLRGALAVERVDTVRAALLGALAALGEGSSAEFDEERLLAQARGRFAHARSRVGRLLPLAHLPPLNWADGRPVPPDLVRGWIVLADRLQDPGGNAFLDRLLGALDPDSAARLGQLVLAAFIAHDTRRVSEEEAHGWAAREADAHVQRLRQGSVTVPDAVLRQKREQVLARKKAARLRQYVGSAQAHRGILALAWRAQPGALVSAVSSYLREQPRRTAQARALLAALAHQGSPQALQLLAAIARGHRRVSLRQQAAALLEEFAGRRSLSPEALLDQSIPAGGLDEGGRLALASGYRARIDGGLAVLIENPRGRVIQGLPSGHEGRRALAQLRRDLQATLAQQTARLHEAMCLGRTWRGEELQLLLAHPIAGRLCRRLIFARLGPSGEVIGSFRPLGDGSLTDAGDRCVDLGAFLKVRLAHRMLLEAEQAAAWRQHLQDYRVTPLFEQLARPLPLPDPAGDQARAITECEGHLLDTATLSRAAGRLGYHRGRSHGGVFSTYEKPFAAGLTVVIEVTASPVARHVPCALLSLWAAGSGSLGEHSGVPLGSLPPVLLAEARNDLREIAAAGGGFDQEWRSRVLWDP